MDIGLRFKLFRVCADLKQREVADALQVSVNYVSMIERGKREPTLKYLREFATVVNVPASLLLWEMKQDESADEGTEKLRRKISALIAEFAASQSIS